LKKHVGDHPIYGSLHERNSQPHSLEQHFLIAKTERNMRAWVKLAREALERQRALEEEK
jgi:hypothetical protein